MKGILYIDSMNGKLQCLARYSNGGITITSNDEEIEEEISKIIPDKVVKWKIDKNDEISIRFPHHIIVLEDINLLKHKSLSKLKYELYKKLAEYKIKYLMNSGIKLVRDIPEKVKGIPKKVKVVIVVSAASVTALASASAMLNSSDLPEMDKPTLTYDEFDIKNEKPNYNHISIKTEFNEIENVPVKTEQTTTSTTTLPVSSTVTKEEKPQEISKSPQEIVRDNIVREYADMYFIDYKTAKNLISENSNNIDDKSFELDVIKILRDYHNNDDTIDKTPIISQLSETEKERIILHFANVYGIYDEDELAMLLAAHRVETGHGTSDVYLNYNNFGGVMVDGEYLKYKTVEIGAESFVRNFQIIMNNTIEHIKNGDEGYDPNISLAHNMDREYCGETYENGEPTWGDLVDELSVYAKEDVKDFCEYDSSIFDEETTSKHR